MLHECCIRICFKTSTFTLSVSKYAGIIQISIQILIHVLICADCKISLQEGTAPNYSWTPKLTQPQSTPPDYQHNVYIPGTTTGYSTLKLAPRGELDVYNTFSTFGKKRRFLSHYEPTYDNEDGLITNDIFHWDTNYTVCGCYISNCVVSSLTIISPLWNHSDDDRVLNATPLRNNPV